MRRHDTRSIGLTHYPDGRSADVHTFLAADNSPSPRVGAATTALNGKIYMFSGRGGEAMAPVEEKGHVWVLDAAKDTWTDLPPSSDTYPEARSYHCMTNDGHKTIYVHAGCPESGRLSDLWAFDIFTATWKQLASAPDQPRGGPSIAYADSKLYRMNGFDGKTEQGGNLDVFDPSTNSWTSISFAADGKSGPGPRSVAALLPIRLRGDTILVTLFGESDPSSLGHLGAGKMLSDGWAYSIKDRSWQLIEHQSQHVPDPRGWFDADVGTIDGKDGVIVVGGLGESNNRLNDAWLLSFA